MRSLLINTIALCTAILILIAFSGCESNPTTSTNSTPAQNVFIKVLGNRYSEQFYKTIRTSDGGYLSVGRTVTNGAYDDMFILKTSPALTTAWAKFYGTVGQDVGYDVVELNGGDVITAGNSNGISPPYTGTWITRISPNGNIKWSKYFFAGFNGHDEPSRISKCIDGSILLFAFPGLGGCMIVKMDTTGSVLWSHLLSEVYWDQYTFGLSDGGAMIIGEHGQFAKISSEGIVTWRRAFGTSFGSSTFLCGIEDQSGNIICGGACEYAAQKIGGHLLKLGPDGTVLWAKVCIGTIPYFISSLLLVPEGIITSGCNYLGGFVNSGLVSAFGSDGELRWTKSSSFGTPDFRNIFAYPDGGYVVFSKIDYAPNNGADVGIFKLNSSGEACIYSDSAAFSLTDIPVTNNYYSVLDSACTVSLSELPITVTDVSLNENTICTH